MGGPSSSVKGKKRFRAPLAKAAPRRYKPVPESDPVRRELVRICALRDTDPDAFAKESRDFVADNMGLAWDYCESLEVRHVPLADLVQAASIGLLKAIQKFDPTKAGKFSTYAVWWLKHAVGQVLTREESLVCVPQDLLDIRREIDWIERAGPATDEQILAHLATKTVKRKDGGSPRPKWRIPPTADKIAEARGAYLGHSHKAVDHRRLSHDADMPSAPEDLLALRGALAALPARERAVLAAEFGFEGRSGAPTMRDESDAATEQIRAMAMRKLRAALAG